MIRIFVAVRIRASRFAIFALVGGPIDRFPKGCRVLDDEVIIITSTCSNQLAFNTISDELYLPRMIFHPRYSPYLFGLSLFTIEYMTALLLSQFNFPSSSEAKYVLSNSIELIILPFDQGYLILMSVF